MVRNLALFLLYAIAAGPVNGLVSKKQLRLVTSVAAVRTRFTNPLNLTVRALVKIVFPGLVICPVKSDAAGRSIALVLYLTSNLNPTSLLNVEL